MPKAGLVENQAAIWSPGRRGRSTPTYSCPRPPPAEPYRCRVLSAKDIRVGVAQRDARTLDAEQGLISSLAEEARRSFTLEPPSLCGFLDGTQQVFRQLGRSRLCRSSDSLLSVRASSIALSTCRSNQLSMPLDRKRMSRNRPR